MYRKKLMRVCLTGVMVVSIATANVAPVFAAEPVEKVETESDSWDSISGEINFRDTDNNESIFVQFNNEKVEDYRWGDDPKDTYEVLPAETVKKYLPEGYELVEGIYSVAGGETQDSYFVYAEVKKVLVEETQDVKINYYDEAAGKQVAEVPVQVSIDTSCVNMAILTRYLPEGYTIEGTDCIIRDGYVYVSVKKDVEIREAVLHITFETPNGEVVTTETVTAEGADGEDAVFRLGVDFNLPTGYKLSNDRDQVTEITIPFGSTGGHTMVVEKGDLSSIVKIQFVDAENNDEVVAGGDYFVDGDGDGIFHTREITEWVPEGYELQEVGDFQVELYKETPLQLSVTKIKEDKPETPDPEEPNKPEKPEDPDKEDTNNKDDKKEDTKKEDKKKNSPKTGDDFFLSVSGSLDFALDFFIKNGNIAKNALRFWQYFFKIFRLY